MNIAAIAVVQVLLLSCAVSAQPVLFASDFQPAIGDTVRLQHHDLDTAQNYAGPAGANVIWDLSDFVSSNPNLYTVVDPDNLANAPYFMGCSYAMQRDSSTYFGYYAWSPLGLYYYGFDDWGNGDRYVLSNKTTLLEFPTSYGSQFRDTVAATTISNFDTLGSFHSHATTITDAYGTLKLPYGAITNVLRVHRLDTLFFGTLIGAYGDEYRYYKAGVNVPLARITKWTQALSLLPQVNYELEYVIDPALVDTVLLVFDGPLRPKLHVYPNPASDVVNVQFPPTGKVQRVFVTDITGRIVTDMKNVTGTTFGFDIARLQPGIYCLSAAGDHFASRESFVKAKPSP